MNIETVKALVFAVVCGIVAAMVMRRFIEPWKKSKDKTPIGRLQHVLDENARLDHEKATAYGSLGRTLYVVLANCAFLTLLALATYYIGSAWVACYPIVGLVVLAILKVPRDRRMRSDASCLDRLFMRMYQAWSWPLWGVWALRR